MKRIIRIAVAMLLAISTVFCFTSCLKLNTEEATQATQETEAPTTAEATTQAPATVPSLLTGLPLAEGEEVTRPIGIVVENTPAARPQWGFTTPQMVIEYEVEGGITRMLWLYDKAENIPEAVGPVRSLRHDVAELALGLDAAIFHIGRSSIASTYLKGTGSALDDFDGMYESSWNYKKTDRNVASEHRSVAVGSEIVKRLAEKGTDLTLKTGTLFNFGDRALTGATCNSLYIEYSSSYNYNFSYDITNCNYSVSIGGSTRTDENGNVCTYDNLIILYTETDDLNDSKGHLDIKLENGGTGLYVNGGIAENITWTKTSDTECFKLYASDGSELVLNRGVSYVGFVRSDNAVKTVLG